MRLADLRYALRVIRLHPAPALAVILTLAVGIGAVSTLATVIHAALLAPLPVERPDRLVNIYTTTPEGSGFGAVSYPDFEDLAAAAPAEGYVGYSGLMATIADRQSSEVVFGEVVTADYFPVLGVRAAVGRTFTSADEPGRPSLAVISDRLWRRRFAADPAIVGRDAWLNGHAFTIAGVAPATFGGLLVRGLSADVFVPVWAMGHVRADQRTNRGERWMFAKARLAPGGSLDALRASADTVAARLREAHPATNRGRTFRLVPTSQVMVHPEGDRGVAAVAGAATGAAVLVLLVACANLAGVMLARGLARRPELAVRGAIGASRLDLLRQLLTEGAVLGLLGGAGGLLLTRWAAALLVAWRPDLPVPVSLNVGLDWPIAFFTLLLTMLATAAFALLPAWRGSRTPPAGSPAASGVLRTRRLMGARHAMLVPQLALAALLLTVALLFTRSLGRADAVDPGFDVDRTGYVALNLAMSGYDENGAARFHRELKESLGRMDGIEGAALAGRVPLDLYGDQSVEADVEGRARVVQAGTVGAGYFEVLGIPVRGRSFTARDEAPAAPEVVIVSAAAARAFWAGGDAADRTLRVGGRLATVIGVADDVKVQTLGEPPQPLIYRPLREGRASLLRLVFRSSRPAETVARVRERVRAQDPGVAIFESRTMEQHLRTMLYPYRAAASIGSVLAAIAVTLAAVGLYGVLACGVSERLRDLAVRSALGAPPLRLLLGATRQAAAAAAIGLTGGFALSLVAARLLTHVVFGMSPFDPLTFAAVALLLATVVGLAAVAPIRRILRMSPMAILKAL